MSKVLVITTSLRARSNSDRLAEELVRGAKDAGHDVECISLKKKDIWFCIGCLSEDAEMRYQGRCRRDC